MLKARISFMIALLTVILTGQMCLFAQTSVVARSSEDLSTVQLENVKIDTQSVASIFC